jgi:hypothetical protein
MASKPKYTSAQVIAAIRQSGGIKSTIARTLGCSRTTLDRYLLNEKIEDAYNEERERVWDIAESVVIGNINLAAQTLQLYSNPKYTGDKKPIDTGDAKWLLARTKIGRERGFGDEIELISRVDFSSLPTPVLEKIARGESVVDAILEYLNENAHLNGK